MVQRASLVLGLLCGVILGCGDDGGSAIADAGIPDGNLVPDADPPDAAVCPTPATGPGATCPGGADTECDSAAGAADGICLSPANSSLRVPAEGYCLNFKDNMNGLCLNDSECPAGSICAGGDISVCMQPCCADFLCPVGRQCSTKNFFGTTEKLACVPGDGSAADGDDCVTIADCYAGSQCSEGLNAPNGQCFIFGCVVGDDSTCSPNGDGHCVQFTIPGGASTTSCVDVCATNADCREVDGYVCFDGTAQGAGKYCRHPDAGDACVTAADCGGDPWVCRTGVGFPGGYCTIDGCGVGGVACPASKGPDGIGSICTGGGDPFCAQACTLGDPTSCRPGYLCAQQGGGPACVPIP